MDVSQKVVELVLENVEDSQRVVLDVDEYVDVLHVVSQVVVVVAA
jgi:hypothetical protein